MPIGYKQRKLLDYEFRQVDVLKRIRINEIQRLLSKHKQRTAKPKLDLPKPNC